jgi:hypothetical protein
MASRQELTQELTFVVGRLLRSISVVAGYGARSRTKADI